MTDSAATGPATTDPELSDDAPARSLTSLLAKGTVQWWFVAMASVLLGSVVVGSVVALSTNSHTQSLTDTLSLQLSPSQSSAYRLQAAYLNQETGIRGYALTGNEDFLTPYNDGVAMELEAIAQLHDRLGEHPDLLFDVDAVQRAADVWRETFVEQVFNAPIVDGAPELDPVLVEEGRATFDEVRATFRTQNERLADARRDLRTELTGTQNAQVIILTTLFAVLAILCVGTGVLIRRAVITPLRRVAASSREVAQGQFDLPVESGSAPSDIRGLASDIDAMRRRIVSELAVVRERELTQQHQSELLDAQATELRRSNAELEQFAYVASHDLQEPLRKVTSFCQLLEKRYDDKLDDRGRQYIDFAVDGAKRMQILINDLLTFSRVGRGDEDFQLFRLDTSLDLAVKHLDAAITDTDTVITRPDALPQIEGEPLLMTMLWQNLIGNAIKFAKSGVAPEISITATDEGDQWTFCVQDNGIGIAEEFAEKVFVIFQRLHGRDEHPGTGIGLSLCKKIVEYHSGRIWLDTNYTDGSRICFTLPNPDANPDASEAPTGNGNTVGASS